MIHLNCNSSRGDSGGPLMRLSSRGNPPHWLLVGVVSYGRTPCGQPGWPAVYTKVRKIIALDRFCSHYFLWLFRLAILSHGLKQTFVRERYHKCRLQHLNESIHQCSLTIQYPI